MWLIAGTRDPSRRDPSRRRNFKASGEGGGGGGEGDLVFIDGPIIHFSSEADQVSLDRAERIGTR